VAILNVVELCVSVDFPVPTTQLAALQHPAFTTGQIHATRIYPLSFHVKPKISIAKMNLGCFFWRARWAFVVVFFK